MQRLFITEKLQRRFAEDLRDQEKSAATVEKYLREARRFAEYAGGNEVSRRMTLGYKAMLGSLYSAKSANSMLAALNSLFRFARREDLCVRQFRLQRDAYRPESEELTRDEYVQLISAAEHACDYRSALILQTLCCTGIRIGELGYVTVEAAKEGGTSVCCKGKTRRIFIVSALRKKLLRYAEETGVSSGPVFLTRTGRPVDRTNVWRKMKKLCAAAGIPPQKAFPHNLRHLFARTFYEKEHDISTLADILGHSSVNTTRIYIISTGAEHAKRMEGMDLVT